MKNLLTILAIVFFVGPTWAQTTEYLQQKDFRVEKQKIYDGINASRRQLNEMRISGQKMEQSMDSLKQVLSTTGGKLGIAADSLSKTSARLTTLQEKIDREKFMSRGVSILFIVVLCILFIVLFSLTYLFKKRAELDHQAVAESVKKTDERLDEVLKNLKEEILSFRNAFDSRSGELNQRISSGMAEIGNKNRETELHLHDNLARMEGRIDLLGPEISKFRIEHSEALKVIDEKINVLKGELEKKSRVLTDHTDKLEGMIRMVNGNH